MIRRAIGHYNTLSENRSRSEQTIYAEFGRRLQARMMQLGWNQSELSRRATAYLPKPAKGQVQGHSLGRDRISSYVRGKYLPRPDALDAIAKALQCKAADLLPPEGVPAVAPPVKALNISEYDDVRKCAKLEIVMTLSMETIATITALVDKDKTKRS